MNLHGGIDLDTVQKWFDELAEQAQIIVVSMTERTESRRKKFVFGREDEYERVVIRDMDVQTANQWQSSTKSLLFKVFGEKHPTYQDFAGISFAQYRSLHAWFNTLKSIFDSAKQQFENGHLFDINKLIHAEVFDTELDLALHYLEKNHRVASVVTAGVVLESTVRKMCGSISHPIGLTNDKGKPIQTDTLITELRKAEVFDESMAKQLRAWMGVRNDAAHGNKTNEQFDDNHVKRMIDGVRDFVDQHLN